METEREIHQTRPAETRRRGQIVFAVLAVLTVIEFAVSVGLGGVLPVLAVIALAKAALIVIYFMHVGELGVIWQEEVSR